MSRLIVTSASGSNGDGYGTVLAFTPEGELMGRFSDDDRISRIMNQVEPRELSCFGNVMAAIVRGIEATPEDD